MQSICCTSGAGQETLRRVEDVYRLKVVERQDSLKGAKYFSSLDLAHGYHQVPMAEKDIEKTAFRVGTGGFSSL